MARDAHSQVIEFDRPLHYIRVHLEDRATGRIHWDAVYNRRGAEGSPTAAPWLEAFRKHHDAHKAPAAWQLPAPTGTRLAEQLRKMQTKTAFGTCAPRPVRPAPEQD